MSLRGAQRTLSGTERGATMSVLPTIESRGSVRGAAVRAARGRVPLGSIEASGLAVAAVVALGFAEGGFFPRAWGWATVGLSAVALGAIASRREVTVSRRAAVLLALLAALGLVIVASFAWTRSVGLGVLELQRLLVYLAGVGAAAVLVGRRTARALVVGVYLAACTVSLWGLVSYFLTRERTPDVFQGAYLHRPLGYANAMAIAGVLAIVLGLGLSVDSVSRRARAAASIALVPLAAALALTGSRAAIGTLLVGAAVAVALVPDRGRTIGVWRWILVVPALTVLALSLADPTDSATTGPRADLLGERLLLLVAALTLIAAPPALMATRPDAARIRGVGRGLWIALGVAAAGAVVVMGIARFPGLAGDRPVFWRVAAEQFEERPLLGSGAGTYAQVWLERRTTDDSVRDAHSIVAESLGELGVVGGALVLLLLVLPLLWGYRARTQPLVPATAGAFAAFAVHASVDWDWEMPAIALAGLFCAVALAVAADGRARALRLGRRARAVALAACGLGVAVGLVGFLGASALEDANRSLARGDAVAATREARSAERWQPWSAEPSLLRGRAALAVGDRDAARRLFTRAAAWEPNDYRMWLALAAATDGAAADAAVLRARDLNPRAVRDAPSAVPDGYDIQTTEMRGKEGP